MLPNHAPLVVAEQFGTLATLYPDRIDLGLGRAPGTDMLTARALRRDLATSAEQFPQDVMELQAYFEPTAPGQAVRAIPGEGTRVPLWILGSSLFGASRGQHSGLPLRVCPRILLAGRADAGAADLSFAVQALPSAAATACHGRGEHHRRGHQ